MGAETVVLWRYIFLGSERDVVGDVLDLFHLLHDLGVDNGKDVSANGRDKQNYPWLKDPVETQQ